MGREFTFSSVHSLFNLVCDCDCSQMKISAEDCDKKWRNIMATYKRIIDNGHKTGRGGKAWVYFERMNDIVGKSPANVSLKQFVVPTKPVFSCSTATTSADRPTTSTATTSSSSVIEPTSDTEAEDVLVEQSAVELVGKKRKRNVIAANHQNGSFSLRRG